MAPQSKSSSTRTRAEQNTVAIERLEALGYSHSLPPSCQSIADSPIPPRSLRHGLLLQSAGKRKGIHEWAEGVEREKTIEKSEKRDAEDDEDEGDGRDGQKTSGSPVPRIDIERDLRGSTRKLTSLRNHSKFPSIDKPASDLTPEELLIIVRSHKQHVLRLTEEEDVRKREAKTKKGKSTTPSQRQADRLQKLTLQSNTTPPPTTSPRKRRSLTTSTSSSSSSSSSVLDSPTRRLSSPSKRRAKPTKVSSAVSLLTILASSAGAASVESSFDAIFRHSPTLTLPDIVQLSRSLQENAQMLAIAQVQTHSNHRTFGSSFTTLARLVTPSSTPAPPSGDFSAAILAMAKGLDLFTVPDPNASTILPASPSPRPAAPLLILTTPRTACLQCDSALTLRSKPSGPFHLVSPSEGARSILAAVHVCTNPACQARHAPDHVEITYLNRTVWIWETEAKYLKVGERVWVTRGFSKHYALLLLRQCVSPGGFAGVWNDLHAVGKVDEGIDAPKQDSEEDELEEEDEAATGSTTKKRKSRQNPFRLIPAHVWKSFVVSTAIELVNDRSTLFITPARIRVDALVQFVNRYLFEREKGVYHLGHHSCEICSRSKRKKWKGGPATEDELQKGVRWSGSLAKEVERGTLLEDTEIDATRSVKFAVCDGIEIGHYLCAFPSCANPPKKHTRAERFCSIHVDFHERCGIVGCGRARTNPTDEDTSIVESCGDERHFERWLEFERRRNAIIERGWRGGTRKAGKIGSDLWDVEESEDEKDEDEGEEGESKGRIRGEHMWSLRRVSKLQLLVHACGVPIAWSKFSAAETPQAVIDFLSLIHSQASRIDQARGEVQSSFPSYIAYDRACDVLRHAVLPPTAISSSASTDLPDPFETPTSKNERRDDQIPARGLPKFLEESRLVVTGFHRQGHEIGDRLCTKFCDATPMDGKCPDLVVPYVVVNEKGSKRKKGKKGGSSREGVEVEGDRIFERAFNTSAAEQLNSSLRGFTNLLQGMKSDNFDFVVNAVLRDKKLRSEGRR